MSMTDAQTIESPGNPEACSELDALKGKKLLVLGGFDPHRNVVEAAHELGVYVIATDYLAIDDAPAKMIADEAWMLNITDVDAIVDMCREQGVDGVINLRSDAAQKPYQEICERLGLPCFATKRQVDILSDKLKFKAFCAENGILTIPHYTEEEVLAGKVEYPVFVKPAVSRGSRGQCVCYDEGQLKQAIDMARGASCDGGILIEKYMGDAQDFTCSYIVIDGVPHLLKVGDRYLGTVEDGLDRQQICMISPTTQIDSFLEKTEPRMVKFIQELGIRFGCFFIQGFIEDGEVYCYDPGIRLPGSDYDVVVKDLTGFDAMKSVVIFALTGDTGACYGNPDNAYRLHSQCGALLAVSVRAGMIGSIEGVKAVGADPRVHGVSVRRKVGDVIKPTGDVTQRVLEFAVSAGSRTELASLFEFIYAQVSIRDIQGEDMIVSRASVKGDAVEIGAGSRGGRRGKPDAGRGRTVLILGAGNFQIDAIEWCRDHGYKVIGCSYRDSDPGISLLDDFRKIDIKDIDGVIGYAREANACAVYSVGSDIAIPTATKAGEMLDLPHFISYKDACACQDKGEMRARISETEWSVPFIIAHTVEDAKAFGRYPAMMKPVDSQGQRGCFKVESDEDIDRLFEKSARHSDSGAVIVERFIDGPEISVNAFLRDGAVEFMMPSDRYSYSEYPGGIIKEHGLPCSAINEASRSKVERLVVDIANRFGIDNGPLYLQIKLDGGDPFVIEVAPRLDGCHMWRFIREYCGYDLLDDTFTLLLENRLGEHGALEPREGDWRLTFMNAAPGTTFSRDDYTIGNATYVQWYYESGETVTPVNGIMEKCGYQIHRVG